MITRGSNPNLALQQLNFIYNKYNGDGIIDLDRRLREKPEFQLYRLEDLISYIGNNQPPSRQTPISITLVLKGQGEKCIGQYRMPVEDNMLFIVPARTVHSCQYRSADCSGYTLTINADLVFNNIFSKQCILNRKVLKNSIHPFSKLNKQQTTRLTAIFEDLLFFSQEETGTEILAIKTLELLIHLDLLFDPQTNNRSLHTPQHPIVEKFTRLLTDRFHLERSVQYYADQLHTHPNYLNFLLKKHLGLSTKECIDQKVITESKYLLTNPTLRIKEVAHQLGFDDPNNFSTFFQKHAGSCPLVYRSSRLGKQPS